jgi:glycosidase
MKQYLLLLSFCGAISFNSFTLLGQQDEVIYHVVQRSFYDSNGDLHGDLNGLRERLNYLQELGITAILLLPLYHSEYYHNYFATDFETIDPEFGTMEDYLALVRDLHKRGMKLYMDMETQYVTEDHLWYRDSYANPNSQYSQYLVYNGPGNTDPESIIFDLTELEGYDGTVRKVATVNLLNEDILNYNINLFSFWADPNGDGKFDDGVDGFRLDHMMDDLDWKGKFTDLFSRFWTPLITQVKVVNPSLVFMAEQAQWESWGTEYLEHGSVDRVFAFNLFRAITSFDKARIMRVADSTFSLTSDNRQFMVFVENHDIKRFATQVDHDPGKLRVGAALNLLLGGTPSIYYGQEIGMSGSGGFGKYGNTDANDIPMREAFEWYASTTGKGMALWYKDTGPWWEQTNLKAHDGISFEEQHNSPTSLWNTYKRLLTLRKQYSALVNGRFKSIANENTQVCSFLRSNTSQNIVVLVNLSEWEQELALDLGSTLPDAQRATSIYGGGLSRFDERELAAVLPAYEVLVVWMR